MFSFSQATRLCPRLDACTSAWCSGRNPGDLPSPCTHCIKRASLLHRWSFGYHRSSHQLDSLCRQRAQDAFQAGPARGTAHDRTGCRHGDSSPFHRCDRRCIAVLQRSSARNAPVAHGKLIEEILAIPDSKTYSFDNATRLESVRMCTLLLWNSSFPV